MNQYTSLLVVFLILFMSSCTPTPNEAMITLEVTRPSVTPSPFVIHTATYTPPPTLTATQTSTALPNSTPTITPTLTLNEKEILLYDLFENNQGCLLPCWWGFIPGQTTWEEAQSRLAILAFYISPLEDTTFGGVSVYLPDPHQIYRLEQGYLIENDLITYIQADILFVPSYSLATVLTTYGQPSEVWVRSQSYVTPEGGGLPFFINLWYPSHGFILGYTQARSTLSEDGIITSCLDEVISLYINVSIWEPIMVSSLNYMDVAVESYFKPNGYELSLEEATGMALETFYTTYKDASVPPCFTTPNDIWPGL